MMAETTGEQIHDARTFWTVRAGQTQRQLSKAARAAFKKELQPKGPDPIRNVNDLADGRVIGLWVAAAMSEPKMQACIRLAKHLANHGWDAKAEELLTQFKESGDGMWGEHMAAWTANVSDEIEQHAISEIRRVMSFVMPG